MNTKPIPIFIVLMACGIASVIYVIQGVEFSAFCTRFIWTTVVFLILGIIVKIILDKAMEVLGVSDIPTVESITQEVESEDNVEEQPQ